MYWACDKSSHADPPYARRRYLLDAAARSRLFAHHLVCALAAEGTPPDDAFNPAVKRSGWKPPADSGLWATADAVRAEVWRSPRTDIPA